MRQLCLHSSLPLPHPPQRRLGMGMGEMGAQRALPMVPPHSLARAAAAVAAVMVVVWVVVERVPGARRSLAGG